MQIELLPVSKAEDSAHSSGDLGIPILGLRRDADTSPVSSDGDYQLPVFDSSGNLKVSVKSIAARTPVNEYTEQAAVVSTTETTLVSYTPGATFHIQGFAVTGQAAGRYKLKVGGTTKAILRTTAAKMSEVVNYQDGVIVVNNGVQVLVTGYHEEIANQGLAANLFGYTI